MSLITSHTTNDSWCDTKEDKTSLVSSNIVLSVSVLTASVDGIDQSVGVFAADTVDELSVRSLP